MEYLHYGDSCTNIASKHAENDLVAILDCHGNFGTLSVTIMIVVLKNTSIQWNPQYIHIIQEPLRIKG